MGCLMRPVVKTKIIECLRVNSRYSKRLKNKMTGIDMSDAVEVVSKRSGDVYLQKEVVDVVIPEEYKGKFLQVDSVAGKILYKAKKPKTDEEKAKAKAERDEKSAKRKQKRALEHQKLVGKRAILRQKMQEAKALARKDICEKNTNAYLEAQKVYNEVMSEKA